MLSFWHSLREFLLSFFKEVPGVSYQNTLQEYVQKFLEIFIFFVKIPPKIFFIPLSGLSLFCAKVWFHYGNFRRCKTIWRKHAPQARINCLRENRQESDSSGFQFACQLQAHIGVRTTVCVHWFWSTSYIDMMTVFRANKTQTNWPMHPYLAVYGRVIHVQIWKRLKYDWSKFSIIECQ